jgi:hypothetical protein
MHIVEQENQVNWHSIDLGLSLNWTFVGLFDDVLFTVVTGSGRGTGV